jgi:hypothetical protein
LNCVLAIDPIKEKMSGISKKANISYSFFTLEQAAKSSDLDFWKKLSAKAPCF